MIDKQIKEKIELKAYGIWEWRKENNVPGCALGDWLEAQSEIITDRRINKNCPIDNFPIFQKDNKLVCSKIGCSWQTEARRKLDADTPNFQEIKKEWQ